MCGYFAKRTGYKKPDLNAPRFKRDRLNILNKELFDKFKKNNPSVDIDFQTFRKIILSFNLKLRQKTMTNRDGVEFPEQLGYLFIGTCPRKVNMTDPITSSEYDRKINFKNWESNQYVCKIFYSNYGTKYRFSNRDMWYFVPCRKFKRSVSATFNENWNKYIKVSPISKVSSFFKDKTIKAIKVKKHDYNNRRVDFSNTQSE